LGDLISKNFSQKRAGGMAQGVAPEFKPQYYKKRKKKENSVLTATLGYIDR
jgi:hypothetical protein